MVCGFAKGKNHIKCSGSPEFFSSQVQDVFMTVGTVFRPETSFSTRLSPPWFETGNKKKRASIFLVSYGRSRENWSIPHENIPNS